MLHSNINFEKKVIKLIKIKNIEQHLKFQFIYKIKFISKKNVNKKNN